MNPERAFILSDIVKERDRQIAKWGDQSELPFPVIITAMAEEFGELAQAVLHAENPGDNRHPNSDWRKEAVQLAAMCVQILEERGNQDER